MPVRVEERGGVFYISSTDMLRNWKTVKREILPEFGTLLVEAHGKVEAVLTTPNNVDTGVNVHTFGEEEDPAEDSEL